jgi:hypothetical protein
VKFGKIKETWRAYRITLAGYQEIQFFNASYALPILGVLAKLGKAAFGFVISICPSVRMEHFRFYWVFRISNI